MEPKEFRANGDKVLVHQNTRARGAASGIELDIDTWAVWTLDDDGLVTRIGDSSTTRRPPSKPPGWRSRPMSQENVETGARVVRGCQPLA